MDGAGSAHRSSFGNLSTEEVTSKIILTAIIVLFIAVFFVLLLHLYAKLYWWRVDQQQLQHHQEQQLPPAPPPITRNQRRRFIFLSGQGAVCNTGLSPSDLNSLPVIIFRKDSCKDGLECAVCLSELVNGDKARLLPMCSHIFHVECIDLWFQSHATCPICRNTVFVPEQARSNPVDSSPDNATAASINNSNNSRSQTPSSLSGSSQDSSNFPTNVLIWGSQDQVSTGINSTASQEDGAPRGQEAVLEINDNSSSANTRQNVSSSSSSLMRFNVEEEEPKSPMTTRLRSLKRFLSRDKRVACSSGSTSSAGASVDP